MIADLIKGNWFGEREESLYDESNSLEHNKLLDYLRQFKQGDFSKKLEFIDFLTKSDDSIVYNLGIRIFLSIANHEDFSQIQEFLGEWEEEKIRIFLAFVDESLSYQTIPYLLALMGEWEETEIEEKISYTVGYMLGYKDVEWRTCSVDELGESFIKFSKKNDLNKYYYSGEEFFVGDLTKTLISDAFICKSNNKPFYYSQISSILSNSTGILCPISTRTVIDDKKINELMDYVRKLADLKFERGCKYFYGVKI